MMQHNWNRTASISIVCFGMMLVFWSSFVNPVGSGAAAVRPNNPKYTIDISTLQGSTSYTLVKRNKEWIKWTNSSSKNLSVYFVADSPFDESCWDVPGNGDNRTNKITVPASPAEYSFDTSDEPCSSRSRKGHIVNTPKVVIQ
jgi:hypothetical protein